MRPRNPKPRSRALPRPKSPVRSCPSWLLSAAHERRHSGVSPWLDALPPDHASQGEPQDPQIQQQAPVVDIPDVQFEFLLPAQLIPAVELRPTGNSRPRLVAAPLKGVVPR